MSLIPSRVHRLVEPDYSALHKASLEKQHDRVCDVLEALVQHIQFIRPSEQMAEEKEALDFAKSYLEKRKPMQSADSLTPSLCSTGTHGVTGARR